MAYRQERFRREQFAASGRSVCPSHVTGDCVEARGRQATCRWSEWGFLAFEAGGRRRRNGGLSGHRRRQSARHPSTGNDGALVRFPPGGVHEQNQPEVLRSRRKGERWPPLPLGAQPLMGHPYTHPRIDSYRERSSSPKGFVNPVLFGQGVFHNLLGPPRSFHIAKIPPFPSGSCYSRTLGEGVEGGLVEAFAG